ncbi:hypothetical protein [Nocardioides sp.]|uniref:hypothetical protein n=1 Tax=Nocardioides sp. TaxID=35761 RepID=UPI0035AF44F2
MTQHDARVADAPEMIQVYLQPDRGSSWRSALLSAVIGAGGGPLYRFVAASPDRRHEAAEHTATGQRFALRPFQDLDTAADDEWADLARKSLAELDAELQRAGWHQLDDRGSHWWSVRYSR